MSGPKLAFETARTAAESRLVVAGELDMATGPSLEETALALLAERPALLVLDLRGVTFCDSSGIACLIRVRRAAAESGGRLELRSVQGLVRRVLELTGVSELLGVRGSEEEPQLPDSASETPR